MNIAGIAVSPRMEAQLKQSGDLGFLQIIIDPRLGELAEVYYSREEWLKRVKEQNEYDKITYEQRY